MGRGPVRTAAPGWADPTDAPRYLDERGRCLFEDDTANVAVFAFDLDPTRA